MSELQLTARFKIHEGQLETFKDTAAKCMACVKEKEPDAKQYDWFITDDGSECVVRETYRSSAALLQHIGNLGPLFGDLLAVTDFSGEICGPPSEELVGALDGMDVTYYSHMQSL